MEIRRILSSHKEDYLLLLILAFAALLYLFNINFSEIWLDESFTKALVRHPYSEFFKLVAGDFHPPLYYLGLKLFTSVVGLNNFTIRLFSVIGAISTLIIGYCVGQRVFGKRGALNYCVLLLSLPMLAAFTHNARMYTWAAFAITGVFLYSCLFLKTNKEIDLILLGVFSLMAAYTHYYCLIAAFWADAFVLLRLSFSKNKAWQMVLAMGVAVFILFLPWFFIMLSQTHAAQKDFWIPEVSGSTLLACYLNPFGQEFALSYWSYWMAAIVYGLTIISICTTFFLRQSDGKIALWLSLVVFNCTVLTAVVLSFTLRPLLYHRYIMCVITMLMVPPAILLYSGGHKWLKLTVQCLILCCGICIIIPATYYSFGPYRQSLDYLQKEHPKVETIIHVSELTAGPFCEYGRESPWRQYYMKNEGSSWYTNMNVFDRLHSIKTLDEVLKKDEIFCMPIFRNAQLNKNNSDLILSQSKTIAVDTVKDNKPYSGIQFVLYTLKYCGDKQKNE